MLPLLDSDINSISYTILLSFEHLYETKSTYQLSNTFGILSIGIIITSFWELPISEVRS
jgi:hypothetical protein